MPVAVIRPDIWPAETCTLSKVKPALTVLQKAVSGSQSRLLSTAKTYRSTAVGSWWRLSSLILLSELGEACSLSMVTKT